MSGLDDHTATVPATVERLPAWSDEQHQTGTSIDVSSYDGSIYLTLGIADNEEVIASIAKTYPSVAAFEDAMSDYERDSQEWHRSGRDLPEVEPEAVDLLHAVTVDVIARLNLEQARKLVDVVSAWIRVEEILDDVDEIGWEQ